MTYSKLTILALASALACGGLAGSAYALSGTGHTPTIYGPDRDVGPLDRAGFEATRCGHRGEPRCSFGTAPMPGNYQSPGSNSGMHGGY